MISIGQYIKTFHVVKIYADFGEGGHYNVCVVYLVVILIKKSIFSIDNFFSFQKYTKIFKEVKR